MKNWISAAKRSKKCKVKKELEAHLEALIYSFERFKYVFQYEYLISHQYGTNLYKIAGDYNFLANIFFGPIHL